MEPLSSSNQMTTCEIGATFHGPDITPPTNPVHSSSRLTGVSLTVVVAAAAQDITSTATLSHILERSEQQDSDIAAPNAELEFCQPQHMHYHQFQHPVECAVGISRYRCRLCLQYLALGSLLHRFLRPRLLSNCL